MVVGFSMFAGVEEGGCRSPASIPHHLIATPAGKPKGAPEWVCRPKACGMFVYMFVYVHVYVYVCYVYVSVNAYVHVYVHIYIYI